MFYIIGIGLGDVKDITVRGLEIVQNASRVYLESYTSILPESKRQLVSILCFFDECKMFVDNYLKYLKRTMETYKLKINCFF